MSDSTHRSPSCERRGRGENPRYGESDAANAAFRLEHELAAAVRCETIQVHYQPQYDAVTGRGCGVEALARWALVSGEPVAATTFIAAAERLGLIHELGRLMLRTACETASGWCRRGTEPPTLSVNVSTLQIDATFCRLIEDTLNRCSFPARQLELEITESALIVDPERVIGYINECKDLGVRVAIDDFGTGYSSLSYLTRLPVDRLKIDRSLIQRMTLDGKSVSIMRLILAVAAELGLDVIAEGVETEPELRMLVDIGCPKVQGYLLGRPVPARQAQTALAKTWGNRINSSVGGLPARRETHAA